MILRLHEVARSHGAGRQRYRLRVPALELRAGRQLAIVGPSGCGKSTLLDLLALALAPDPGGRFEFLAGERPQDIAALWRDGRQDRLAALRRQHCGYVLQSGGLLEFLDVRRNIGLPCALLGAPSAERVQALAERLEIGDQLDKKPAALSVGQRQRVAIARALAHAPRLLLADEPTAALDPLNAERVMRLLVEQARERGACTVVATHDERLARAAGLEVLAIRWQREVAAVITPLLVLFGLKYGLVSTLTERLERAPSVREIIPVGGARYRAEDIAALAARADVAFAVPRTRQIAATADLSGGGETALSVEMIPSAAGDPLLAGLPQPDRPTRVVLSHGAAEKLGAQPGERIVARIGRRMDGQAQSQRLELEVLAVLPQERFARDALFAPLALLEAAEDYRDGRAVAAYGWPGKAGETPRARIYPGFRLYARDLDAVEGLRRHFVASGVEVATQAEAIAQVRSLSRNLGLVFWIVAALAIGGAFAAIAASSLAAVERKRRALAVLRLLGFPTAALVGFVMLLALFSAVFGLFLAGLLYAATAGALNHLFDNQSGEFVCRLLPSHYLTALLATLLCSVLAAASGGWRAARIEAAEGLRDV